MDVLDEQGMQGRYLVMSNAPIYKRAEMAELITSRGYKCMYLPTYSPFLNPTETAWSKIKLGVRRGEITEHDALTSRIIEAAKTITVTDCVGWIK